MNFRIAAHSDVGIKKSTNQDAFLLKVAQTGLGRVCLCTLCDGMGGLAMGELASASVIRAMEGWFIESFPQMLKIGFEPEKLRAGWDALVQEENQKLSRYAAGNGTRMGTTIAALLILQEQYYIMNVGDSRVYQLAEDMCQLTKDQTFIQRELEEGRMTKEEARLHPQRNMLLQCIGASETVTPEFISGFASADTTFLVCSDGFRHVISSEEIFRALNPQMAAEEQQMKEQLIRLTELNKQRREADNISAAVIRTCGEG